MAAFRIVVIGGSFGGVNAAYQLRRKLGDSAEITVVSAETHFTFIPSLPWVVMGWRRPDRLRVALAPALARRGIQFIPERAVAIDPKARTVVTSGGRSLPWDRLVLATGADLDWSNVPGSDPAEGLIHTCFTVEQSVRAGEEVERFLARESGRAVVGSNPGASCSGPAYELIMMLESELRRRRKRHRFDLQFLTPEPFLGHFGVNGIGNLSRLMEDEFRSRHLGWHTNAAIGEVRPGAVALVDGAEVEFDLALLIPAFLGARVVREVEGLGNPKGFIPTDRYLRTTAYPDIYAVGVSVAIPPPSLTEVPVGVPKTGHMSEEMAIRAALNLAADLTGRGEMVDGLELPATCIADAGDTAFYIKADPFLPPRNSHSLRKGKWAHYLKAAFERFYLQKVKRDLPTTHFGW
ncbi:MAG: FAD-dependent oxidoreductase [Thermoleophilia bacterium]